MELGTPNRTEKSAKVDLKSCPVSGTEGKRVFQITIGTHIQPKYWPEIKGSQFYFCPDKNCKVIYFNNEKGVSYTQAEVRTPVMHKMEILTENRPACYCMQVTEAEIFEEMVDKHCCDSLIDIQEYTGANKGKDCKITNPSGRCCGAQIKEIIEWIQQNRRNDVKPPVLEEAVSCCKTIESNTIDFSFDVHETP